MVKQKRRIGAKELVADIRAGMGDEALAEKYQLSSDSLEHLLQRLLDSGMITQSELDARGNDTELQVCPSCGTRFSATDEECPSCGVLPRKFEEIRVREQHALNKKRRRARILKMVVSVVVFLFAAVGAYLATSMLFGKKGDSSKTAESSKHAKASDLDLKLIESAKLGDKAKVAALIKQGANVNAQDIGGYSALMNAAANGHSDVVKILLSEGADPSLRGNYYWGETALMMAARKGRKDAAQILLRNGAHVNAKSKYTGSTPLMMAAREGNLDMARFLIQHDADVNATAKDGTTPLMNATAKARWAVAKLLLEHKADVNAAGKTGTALTWACGGGDYGKGHLNMVNLLLDSGADVNGTGSDGWTPLMKASWHNFPEIVNTLLTHTADVNSTNKKGETALILASEQGHEEIVEMLLKKGADVNARDNDGMTALSRAQSRKRNETSTILEQHGAKQ
jgi:ankyrin repeat protein